MSRLFCFDWDNTLHPYDGQLSKSVIEVFRLLKSQGDYICLATGRNSLNNLEGFSYLKKYVDFQILANGAVIKKKNKFLQVDYFSLENVKKLINYCVANDLNYGFDKISLKYVSRIDEASYSAFYESDMLYLKKNTSKNKVISFWFKATIDDIILNCQKEFPNLLFYKWNRGGVSIQNSSDKGGAIQTVLKDLQLDEYIAFGDGANDYKMLRNASIRFFNGDLEKLDFPAIKGPNPGTDDFVEFFKKNDLIKEDDV